MPCSNINCVGNFGKHLKSNGVRHFVDNVTNPLVVFRFASIQKRETDVKAGPKGSVFFIDTSGLLYKKSHPLFNLTYFL